MLWRFIWYSFLGFLLEVGFARVTHSAKRDRKCFLLLPLCPVYGVGALLICRLAGPESHPLWTAAVGFVGATAAELLLGAFYRWVLGVEFWSYRGIRGNLLGLVCLPFSLCWAALALGVVYGAEPLLSRAAAAIPPIMDGPARILLLADGLVSAGALRREGTTQVLRWYR